jgi:hypothetical protein
MSESQRGAGERRDAKRQAALSRAVKKLREDMDRQRKISPELLRKRFVR